MKSTLQGQRFQKGVAQNWISARLLRHGAAISASSLPKGIPEEAPDLSIVSITAGVAHPGFSWMDPIHTEPEQTLSNL